MPVGSSSASSVRDVFNNNNNNNTENNNEQFTAQTSNVKFKKITATTTNCNGNEETKTKQENYIATTTTTRKEDNEEQVNAIQTLANASASAAATTTTPTTIFTKSNLLAANSFGRRFTSLFTAAGVKMPRTQHKKDSSRLPLMSSASSSNECMSMSNSEVKTDKKLNKKNVRSKISHLTFFQRITVHLGSRRVNSQKRISLTAN